MKFSLVIPVAPDRDAEIIESLKNMDYPKSEFHIVVVKGKNPSENRNRGASKAKGKIIGFLDDDATLEPDFLKKVESFFNKYDFIDIVGGPQLTPHDDKYFAKVSGYALSSKFGAAGVASRYEKGKLNLNADESSITSANLFVKKEVMDKIQFDPSLFPGEDPKFIEDSKKQGFKVAYSPHFEIYHRRRPTIKALIKQIFNYGKVRPLKESFFQTLKRPMFLIPSAFVLYLITLIILNSIKYLNWSFFPLFAYIGLSLIFTFKDSIKNKDFKAIFTLPFIYPLIHLSYGCGMIYSYIKKIK